MLGSMVEDLSTVDLGGRPAHGDDVLSPGELVVGRYRIEHKLGAGGMGEVYAARDVELDASIALKAVRPELAADPELRAQFRREVQLARAITHPCVCRLHDLVIDDKRLFLTMERIDGPSLATLLRAGPVGLVRARVIARQIADALAAAHRAGVVHRDIKPGNVLVAPDRAVVTDFGLATPAATSARIAGTPAYMAPEAAAGAAAAPTVDVYAFGCLVWEMVHGAPPFSRTDVASVVAAPPPERPSGDPSLDALLARCLDPEPGKRPADGAALVAALGHPRRVWPVLALGTSAIVAGVVALVATRGADPVDPRAAEARAALRRFDAQAARTIVADDASARGRAELAAAERLLGHRAAAISAAQEAVALAGPDERLLAQARLADASEAWSDAARSYDALVATTPGDVDVRLDLARVLGRAGQLERAASALAAARASAPDDPRVDLVTAEVAFERGDLDAMAAAATRARALAGDASVIAAWARLQQAMVREQRGELDAAAALLAEAEPVLARAGHCARQAGVHRQLASIAWRRSKLDDARAETNRALTIARACGSRAEEIAAISSNALLAGVTGDRTTEKAQLDIALAGYRELGDDQQVAWALQALGNSAYAVNDLRGARELWNQALEVARRLGTRDRIAELLNNLGVAALRHGELPAARLYLDEARAAFAAIGDLNGEAAALTAQGDVALAADNRGEAQARYERAAAIREKIGESDRAVGAVTGLALIELEEGEIDAAERRLIAAQARPARSSDIAAAFVLGRLDVALRRAQASRSADNVAAAEAMRSKLRDGDVAPALLAERDAELALLRGDRDRARTAAAAALAAFREAGDVAGVLRARAITARISRARDELRAIADEAAGRGLHAIARRAREAAR